MLASRSAADEDFNAVVKSTNATNFRWEIPDADISEECFCRNLTLAFNDTGYHNITVTGENPVSSLTSTIFVQVTPAPTPPDYAKIAEISTPIVVASIVVGLAVTSFVSHRWYMNRKGVETADFDFSMGINTEPVGRSPPAGRSSFSARLATQPRIANALPPSMLTIARPLCPASSTCFRMWPAATTVDDAKLEAVYSDHAVEEENWRLWEPGVRRLMTLNFVRARRNVGSSDGCTTIPRHFVCALTVINTELSENKNAFVWIDGTRRRPIPRVLSGHLGTKNKVAFKPAT